MKVLTAAEMRSVDQRTVECGMPGILLMENAAHRVVEFLSQTFSPLDECDVLVFCGKGNNGGDGFAVARQLIVRKLCHTVRVIELYSQDLLVGDAAENRKMLTLFRDSPQLFCYAQNRDSPLFAENLENLSLGKRPIVLDAILGTGNSGPAQEPVLGAIRTINSLARNIPRVAVDMPTGLPSDSADLPADFVNADYTLTFTAPKLSQVLSPTCARIGQLFVFPVGSPSHLIDENPAFRLNLTTEDDISPLFLPRRADSNKGLYGHVLVIGGSFGKSGAPAMSGIGAYRSGAGLVTVGIPKSALIPVAVARPELMTEPLLETSEGHIAALEASRILTLLESMTVFAIGPGIGTVPESSTIVTQVFSEAKRPGIFDADALNVLAALDKFPTHPSGAIRILTPHPGEMGRLLRVPVRDIQARRMESARHFSVENGITLVLKGDRTIIAFPDGSTWINPTGSPAMATGGTGDILTGMIAGLIAQHPDQWQRAVIAAVWLHGRAGELASERLGEQSTLALDLLEELPKAMHGLRSR